MIGRWHVWILGIACHSKCPNDLKFDQSCTHSHNTCLICLDSILMCQKLHHKIHNIWLFFLTFKNLLKRIDSTVDSTVDSIVLPVLPGPVASRRYLNSPTLSGAPRWRMPLFATAATEWPRPRLQGSKGPRWVLRVLRCSTSKVYMYMLRSGGKLRLKDYTNHLRISAIWNLPISRMQLSNNCPIQFHNIQWPKHRMFSPSSLFNVDNDDNVSPTRLGLGLGQLRIQELQLQTQRRGVAKSSILCGDLAYRSVSPHTADRGSMRPCKHKCNTRLSIGFQAFK